MADSAFVNGKIYRVDSERTWAQAVAVRDGQFIAVGSDAEIESYIGPETVVTDLQGRMAMPGIQDLHIHPVAGALMELHECSFPPSATLPEIAARVQSCAADRPPGSWIRGGAFGTRLLGPDQNLHYSFLDAAAPEHPVMLSSSGGHSVWVNSRALKLAGIDKNTTDPENGYIARDEITGEPTGILQEAAGRLVSAGIPDYSPGQRVAAIGHFSRDLNSRGITSIKDASTSRTALAAYADAANQGVLSLRVATSLIWPTASMSREKRSALVRSRFKYRRTLVNPDFAKIFVDGSAGGRKAAYLEPYKSDDSQDTDYYGEFLVTPDRLDEYLVLLDSKGISVKMHCGGDAAVRAALDAIAAARRVNGDSGIPHEISHPNLVSPEDIPRFKLLNAVADLTPVVWYPHPVLRILAKNLGEERVLRMWQIRSIIDTGAIAVYGSDWPAIVPSTNPWRAMEAMITRRDPDIDDPRDKFVPEQSIDLAAAIEVFTRNGAYAMRQADVTGSIDVGKYADMIVLKDNLFDMAAEDIGDTEVLLTLLSGEVVHEQGTGK
ncbi:MAG: amidohydrolase [Gammaproteobacteria bacterium]|nr:amidohydrolase [Gammaproteobacteria bacterium]